MLTHKQYRTTAPLAWVIAAAVGLAALNPLSAGADAGAPPPPPPGQMAEREPRTAEAVGPHSAVIRLETFELSDTPRPRAGFIAEPGIVITNRHCIEGATRARIRLGDDRTIPVAGVIAECVRADLAMLALDAPAEKIAGLPMLRLTDAQVEVGDRVRFLRRDLSTAEPGESPGRIVRIEESIWQGPDLLTSADGDFGDSGSPLLNERNEVIGIMRAGGPGDDGQRVSSAAPATVALALPRSDPVPLHEWWEEYDRPGWRAGRRELQWAYWHLSRGNPEAAARHAHRALEHDPEQGWALGVLARIKRKAGEVEEAVRYFRKWAEVEPDNAAVWTMVGAGLLQAGELEEALDAYQRAIALAPNAYATYGAASALGRLGRNEEAIEALHQTVQLDPDRADIWYYIGVAFHHEDRFDEARRAYAESSRIDPDNPRPLFYIAQIHHKEDDVERAIEYFRRAIEADPGAHESYCGLAYLLILDGQTEEAEVLLEQAIVRKSDCPQTLRGLAYCARARGDHTTAMDWIARLAALDAGAGRLLPSARTAEEPCRP